MKPMSLAALLAAVVLTLAGCQCDLGEPVAVGCAPVAAAPCMPVAAAPCIPSQIYTPPCPGGEWARPAGDDVYRPGNRSAWEVFTERVSRIGNPFRGIGIPGWDCPGVSLTPVASCAPPVAACAPPAAAPCAPPMAAAPCAPVAAAPRGNCGPLPAEARCGEVWCCVFVQPPAAAPVRVCVCEEQRVNIPIPAVFKTECETYQTAPARCEWQQVECGPGDTSQECWKLAEIPPQFAMREKVVCVSPPSMRCEVTPARFEMRASAPPPGYWQWQRNTACEVPVSQVPMSSVPASGPDYTHQVPPAAPPAESPPPADEHGSPDGATSDVSYDMPSYDMSYGGVR